jgi:hypothetical protein
VRPLACASLLTPLEEDLSPPFNFSDEEHDSGDAVVKNKTVSDCKRAGSLNQVPKLIDEKQKKMERPLSAAQQDKLFLQDEKEEK